MKLSSDELMHFFEARTGMGKLLGDVQSKKEIVIMRHGKTRLMLRLRGVMRTAQVMETTTKYPSGDFAAVLNFGVVAQ